MPVHRDVPCLVIILLITSTPNISPVTCAGDACASRRALPWRRPTIRDTSSHTHAQHDSKNNNNNNSSNSPGRNGGGLKGSGSGGGLDTGEDVRPINWANRPKSYIKRTETWDEVGLAS